MARLFYSVEEIAENIEEDFEELEELMALKDGDFYKSYKRGWLEGDMKLRSAIEKAAENGSSPAQQMMLNFQKAAMK